MLLSDAATSADGGDNEEGIRRKKSIIMIIF
jgi:hypothetical protein